LLVVSDVALNPPTEERNLVAVVTIAIIVCGELGTDFMLVVIVTVLQGLFPQDEGLDVFEGPDLFEGVKVFNVGIPKVGVLE
jgi:hypothetical protein